MPAIINNTKMKKTTLINKFEKSIDEVLEALYASRDILELADDIELDEQANELVKSLKSKSLMELRQFEKGSTIYLINRDL